MPAGGAVSTSRVDLRTGGAFVVATEAADKRTVNIRVRSRNGATVLLLTPSQWELRDLIAALASKLVRGDLGGVTVGEAARGRTDGGGS